MSGQRVSAGKGEEKLQLENLPTDVLLVIFWYCDDVSLGRLSQQCRRFYEIISDDFLWADRSRKAIVTNQLSKEIQARSFTTLPLRERCRISANWRNGRFKEKVYFCHKTRYMPWLSLSNELLWLSKGSAIMGYKRKRDGVHANSPVLTLKGHTDDVCRFVDVGNAIISGGRDGALCAWSSESGKYLKFQRESHTSDINDVTCVNDIVVSGSRDRTVKLWRWIPWHERCFDSLSTINIGDRIWSVSSCPQGNICAVGSAGFHHLAPLHIYDLERGLELMNFNGYYKVGAGVLDLHWETPHLLFSTGYDTHIFLWDTRTGARVNTWVDPYDDTMYCLSSDNVNTFVCGAAQHGRVQLWDKRQQHSVQMYFMSANHSSPVYSLAFDPCQLFVALDQSLNVMDFSGQKNSLTSNM